MRFKALLMALFVVATCAVAAGAEAGAGTGTLQDRWPDIVFGPPAVWSTQYATAPPNGAVQEFDEYGRVKGGWVCVNYATVLGIPRYSCGYAEAIMPPPPGPAPVGATWMCIDTIISFWWQEPLQKHSCGWRTTSSGSYYAPTADQIAQGEALLGALDLYHNDFDGDGVLDSDDQCPTEVGVAPSGCADRDLDGVPDAVDRCPDEPGGAPSGCPDSDGDGVVDIDDQCPSQPGPAASNGCPLPDADLDGIPDSVDRCPVLPGDAPSGCPDSDGDGVVDPDDQCPSDPGPAGNSGCPLPDADRDGVPDSVDRCPSTAGPAPSGCPDRDADTVVDIDDQCPDQPGPASNNGCPLDRDGDGILDSVDRCPALSGVAPSGCPDGDGDGVVDIDDQCPNRPGPASNNGCPVPDQDGDGTPDSADRCPGAAGPAPSGCPDSDGDGVIGPDDECPNRPGVASNNGCPDDRDEIPRQYDSRPGVWAGSQWIAPHQTPTIQLVGTPAGSRYPADGQTSVRRGDAVLLYFSESLAANAVGRGSSITIADADGTTARVVCGTNALCFTNPVPVKVNGLGAGIRQLVSVYLIRQPEIIEAGGVAGVQYPYRIDALSQQFRDTEGLTVDLDHSQTRVNGAGFGALTVTIR